MKQQIKLFAFIAFALFALSASAQKQKFGHINADELIGLMPETKQAQDTLKQYSVELEKTLAEMETEYQEKVKDYEENKALMTDLTKETKLNDIQAIEARIIQYKTKANENLQSKQFELLNPILQKATDAVNEVAREHKFTYIFDASPSKAVLVFVENGEDIMPLVKKKLGLE